MSYLLFRYSYQMIQHPLTEKPKTTHTSKTLNDTKCFLMQKLLFSTNHLLTNSSNNALQILSGSSIKSIQRNGVLSNCCFSRAPIVLFTSITVWVSTLCLSLILIWKFCIKQWCYHHHTSNIFIKKPRCKVTYIRFNICVHNSFSLCSQ